ncbi:hypothetical protein BABINDRAFT_54011 [Babjeviella inositovora NRRL Y-12698]|uniref:CN hydrolase domain-containing protein n=1 Tax=Babjeviella inositovora NRRL Y-12698 TaxID=984486 RepID=A0A1E3QKK0_9ASCO|nr:uncharacterized protein BABINDRAFT_54011 [Babjeviella inositovora NRRL Y-12698]ODQ77612.1 hypothetical protein BABINDRAFT_54011 [Babjeviella inositovora NRRL Y-12698]
MKLRIASVQLNPLLGKLEENSRRASVLLEKTFAAVQKPDLVVLPELALTGYNFPSPAAIAPYLEELSVQNPAPSMKWAMDTSRKYDCFTLIGYPETFQSKTYNSAVLVSPSGSIVYNYRKSFLYETDSVWGSLESSTGFETFNLNLNKKAYTGEGGVDAFVKTTIGICMDLNPYKFEAPFNKFEFASHAFSTDSSLILCPMAWLSGKSPSVNDALSAAEKASAGLELAKHFPVEADKTLNPPVIDAAHTAQRTWDYTLEPSAYDIAQPDYSNVNYWALRFFPFMNHKMKAGYPWMANHKRRTVVLCNRSGVESDVLYGGSSSIFQFNGKTADKEGDFEALNVQNKSVDVLGSLGQGIEGVLVRDVEI